MRRGLVVILIITFLVTGCASTTRVPTMSQVLPKERVKIKNCYLYTIDKITFSSNASAALLPLAIIFPPLLLVVWISYTAASTASMASAHALKEATKKCGLTTEQAMEQAGIMNYLEDSNVIWNTKVAPYEVIKSAKPIETDSTALSYTDCKIAKIEVFFNNQPDIRKPKYKVISYYRVCRDEEGDIAVADKSFSEEEYKKLVTLKSQVKPKE